jgi:polar amino acid transport system permease protein
LLDLPFMLKVAPKLLRAAGLTLELGLICTATSVLLGVALGTVRVLGPPWASGTIRAVVAFVRGVPPITVVALIYFGLPELGLTLSEFATGVAALTLVGAAYAVEIVRGAVAAVGQGQWEAALALGLGRLKAYVLVVLPQAARPALPPLTNELANLIKASSLLSVISVNELTKVGNDLIFEHFVVVEVLLQVTLLYLLIIGGLSLLSDRLEQRLRRVPAGLSPRPAAPPRAGRDPGRAGQPGW